MQTFKKDPGATLDYAIDWSARLATDETIVSSTWVISAKGASSNTLEIVGTPTTIDGKSTVYLRGGAKGERYVVTNRITTDASPTSRVDERSFVLALEDL